MRDRRPPPFRLTWRIAVLILCCTASVAGLVPTFVFITRTSGMHESLPPTWYCIMWLSMIPVGMAVGGAIGWREDFGQPVSNMCWGILLGAVCGVAAGSFWPVSYWGLATSAAIFRWVVPWATPPLTEAERRGTIW